LILPCVNDVGIQDAGWNDEGEKERCDTLTWFVPEVWLTRDFVRKDTRMVAAVKLHTNVQLGPELCMAAAWRTHGSDGEVQCHALVGRDFDPAGWESRDVIQPAGLAELKTKWMEVGGDGSMAGLLPGMRGVDFPARQAHLVISWLLEWVEERRQEIAFKNGKALTVAAVTAFGAERRAGISGMSRFLAKVAFHAFDMPDPFWDW